MECTLATPTRNIDYCVAPSLDIFLFGINLMMLHVIVLIEFDCVFLCGINELKG